MRNVTEHNITAAVVGRFESCADPRLKEILTSLVRHLHAFIKETGLTEAEWLQGIEFLTATGDMTNAKRQEFILLSDTLGVSMLTVAQNHASRLEPPRRRCSARSMSPTRLRDGQADIGNGAPGEPLFVDCTHPRSARRADRRRRGRRLAGRCRRLLRCPAARSRSSSRPRSAAQRCRWPPAFSHCPAGRVSSAHRRPRRPDAHRERAPSLAAGTCALQDPGARLSHAHDARVSRWRPLPRQRRRLRRARFSDRRLRPACRRIRPAPRCGFRSVSHAGLRVHSRESRPAFAEPCARSPAASDQHQIPRGGPSCSVRHCVQGRRCPAEVVMNAPRAPLAHTS